MKAPFRSVSPLFLGKNLKEERYVETRIISSNEAVEQIWLTGTLTGAEDALPKLQINILLKNGGRTEFEGEASDRIKLLKRADKYLESLNQNNIP